MDAVVGWQVKGRLAAVARIMVRREEGGAHLALYERGRREGLQFAEEPFRNIWSAPLSLCLYPLLPLSLCACVSFTPSPHSFIGVKAGTLSAVPPADDILLFCSCLDMSA